MARSRPARSSARAAAPSSSRRPRRRYWDFRARPRLHVAVVTAIAAALLMPGSIDPTQRAVIGWDIGAAVFLILTFAMALAATPHSMQRRAQFEDQARWAFLGLMAAAAWFSMFAMLGILHQAKAGAGGGVSLTLTLIAGTTILLSWVFVHSVFAVHYAHEFYADRAASRPPGLLFPGEAGDPDYWDFLYYSFVIGMTCQVSDVQIATKPWRRLSLAHGIVAFLFNTVVLALSINLLAGLL